jgi:hypothetical protein
MIIGDFGTHKSTFCQRQQQGCVRAQLRLTRDPRRAVTTCAARARACRKAHSRAHFQGAGELGAASPYFVMATGTTLSWYGRDPRYMITNVARMTDQQEHALSGSSLANFSLLRWLRGEI